MGGNAKGKDVKIFFTDKNGNKIQVGTMTAKSRNTVLENQRRGALLDNMKNMRRGAKQKEKSFKDKINEAKNKKELRAVMTERYGEDNVSTKFTSKNVTMVKRAMSTLDDLERMFPEMAGKVHSFTGNNAKAYASMHPSGVLNINGKWSRLDDPELYGDHNGWFHKNRNPEAVIAHEFGHVIGAKILEKIYPNVFNSRGEVKPSFSSEFLSFADAWNTGSYLRAVENRALSKLGGKYASGAEARQQISRYAGKDISEGFAEAFADWFTNRDNANEVSRAYAEALIEELRK